MRKIIHVDMDCFFAAVEMRDDPSLRDIPLAIGGSADRRGVISTANYPARRYGVHSAMSRRWRSSCARISPCCWAHGGLQRGLAAHPRNLRPLHPLIEPLSLDEAYLDVTDSPQCNGSATLIAGDPPGDRRRTEPHCVGRRRADQVSRQNRLRDEQAERAICDHAGAGTGVFAAAAAQQDPRRRQGDRQAAGRGGAYHLRRRAAIRFGAAPQALRQVRPGAVGAVRGIDRREISSERLRKSVGVERTLAEDIHDWEDCETLIIDKLYPELEMRLRKVKPDLHIARQGVKLKFQDFQQTTQEHVFPVLNRQDLLEVARQAWRERREGRGVRLVGLHVTLLDPQLERQLALPWE